MREKKISIAMAVYNGEKYIREQIDSILCQMEDNDEIVISCDPCSDNTMSIIKSYSEKDTHVRVVENYEHSKGLVSNFENALKHCTGDIIFYSDQDDVWINGKLQTIYEKFEDPKIAVVIHDAKLVDANLDIISESTFKLRGGARNTIVGNLFRLSYIGCCMAFRGDLLPVVLPLVTNKRSHDWWTGCICMCYGKMEVVEQALVLHRMHTSNATPKKRASLGYQISVRVRILLGMILRRKKVKLSDMKGY